MDLTPADHTKELLRLSRSLDTALDDLSSRSVEWARAKDTLRRAEARQYAVAKSEERTEAARSRYVTDHTLDEAFAADMADALKNSAAKAVQARIAQLSAGQTIGSGLRAEMNMAGRYS